MFTRMLAPIAGVLLLLPTSTQAVQAQGRVIESAGQYSVVPHRERVAPVNDMTEKRLATLLPKLMEETELDMWLVINREYAEDPVYFSLVPQPTFAARRTTMLIFNRLADGTVEKLSVNTYPFGSPYESVWSGGDLDEQWRALAKLIVEKNPQRIGINVSRDWPVADGLTKGLHQRLLDVLPVDYASRLTSAEELVVRWVELEQGAASTEFDVDGHSLYLDIHPA